MMFLLFYRVINTFSLDLSIIMIIISVIIVSIFMEKFMCLLSSDSQKNNRKKSLKPARKHRYKLWELHSRYHCSVLGTCLTIKELRHIATKMRMSEARALSDYDLHLAFNSVLSKGFEIKSFTPASSA